MNALAWITLHLAAFAIGFFFGYGVTQFIGNVFF